MYANVTGVSSRALTSHVRLLDAVRNLSGRLSFQCQFRAQLVIAHHALRSWCGEANGRPDRCVVDQLQELRRRVGGRAEAAHHQADTTPLSPFRATSYPDFVKILILARSEICAGAAVFARRPRPRAPSCTDLAADTWRPAPKPRRIAISLKKRPRFSFRGMSRLAGICRSSLLAKGHERASLQRAVAASTRQLIPYCLTRSRIRRKNILAILIDPFA